MHRAAGVPAPGASLSWLPILAIRSAFPPGRDEYSDRNMPDYWILLLFAGYFIVMKWVLPRFGVST